MDGSRYFKIWSIICLISISVGVVGTHQVGNLWPTLSFSIVLPLVIIVVTSNDRIDFHPAFLLLPIGLGIFLRLYTYGFPASMVGIDPDSFASTVQEVAATGSTDVISAGFYSEAPGFFILTTEVKLITDIQTTTAFGIYPVLSGIFYPLITFILIKLVVYETKREWYGLLGSTVAAVGAASVALSYQPIAQTVSVILWLVLIYLVVKYISEWEWRATITVLFLFVAVLYTHKLPLSFTVVILFLVVLTAILIYFVPGSIGVGQSSSLLRNSIVLLSLGSVLLSVQYFYAANTLASNVVYRFLGLFGPQSDAALRSGPFEAAEATPIGRELRHIVVRRLHGLVLIPAAGLAWSVVAIGRLHQREFQPNIIVLLTGAAVGSMFIIVSLSAPAAGEGAARFLVLVEPILVTIVVVAFYHRRRLIKWLIVLLIISQLFSGLVISPDHPNGGDKFLGTDGVEKYLSAQDLAAKEHGNGYVQDTIHTDTWTAGEMTPQQINKYEPSEQDPVYEGFNDSAFLNGVLIDEDYRHVLLRNQTVFRTGFGWYKITWRPVAAYNLRYNEIYTNDDASIYGIRGS